MKKFIISICTMSIVVILLVTFLLSFIFSFNGINIVEGFEVSYVAKNVQATILAEYKIGNINENTSYTTITTTDNESIMTFSGNETDKTMTKSFNRIENLVMDRDDVMIIHYAITNTDTINNTSFNILFNSNIETSSNLSIKYTYVENAILPNSSSELDCNSVWFDNFDILNYEMGGIYDHVEVGKTMDLYIKIEVETKTKDALFDGQFNFELLSN